MEKLTEVQEILEQIQQLRRVVEDCEDFCLLNEVEIHLESAENELNNIISEIEDGYSEDDD